MTTKQLNDFLKRANKIVSNYEDKLNTLNYDYFIISSIVFTSDTDYYYLFSVFSDNKVIDKIKLDDASKYKDTFRDLANKYKTNVIYNYNDLTFNQLKYLETLEDNNINQSEVSDTLFKRGFEIF
jgi:hypothetical protein